MKKSPKSCVTSRIKTLTHEEGRLTRRPSSVSKKSGWSWAFSDRYGRMDKGDERCWNVGGAVKIYAQNCLQAPAE